MYPEYLMHYGVRGQRWGIKKFRRKKPKYGPLYNNISSDQEDVSYGRKKMNITSDGIGYRRDPNRSNKVEPENTDNVKYFSQIGEQIFKRLFKTSKRR